MEEGGGGCRGGRERMGVKGGRKGVKGVKGREGGREGGKEREGDEYLLHSRQSH